MIRILAKDDGKGTALSIEIKGNPLQTAQEAAHIIEHLPEQLEEASSLAYLLFLALQNDLGDTKIEELISEFSFGEDREEEQDGELN